MKKTLLSLITLTFAVVGFSQSSGTQEIDANGKVFYKQELIVGNSHNQSNRAPTDLELDWSNPDFNISDNPDKDSWNPRMDVSNSGNAYVVYNDNHTNGLQKIMFRKKVEGQDWTTPIFVDTGNDIGDRNNHFPAVAASPNGDLHVTYNVWAFEEWRNFIGYSYYNSATDTWNDGLKISDAGGTVHSDFSHHDIYSTDDNLPVVVWGYDFRENEINEEIYMKYFDGSNWSSDIPVSDITDGINAGNPNIKSIGNQKAMIIYSEGNSGAMEMKYKIYDETTHNLTPAKTITSENVLRDNYVLVSSPTGDVMILTIHKESSPMRDVINLFDYNRTDDSFSLSDNTFTFEVNEDNPQLLKWVAMDCNSEGDCAVIITDNFADSNSFLEYNKTSGFGSPLVINEESPGKESPSAKFDVDGNLHVVWNDYRFNDGQGYDEREVFYKKGVNTNLGIDDASLTTIAVYPNPSKGTFTIDTQDQFNLQIFDVLGRSVNTKTISGTTEINHALSPGTYYLRFTNGQSIFVKKLLVE